MELTPSPGSLQREVGDSLRRKQSPLLLAGPCAHVLLEVEMGSFIFPIFLLYNHSL